MSCDNNVVSLAHLAFPAILWYRRHHWHKAEGMISFITRVTDQHFVVITWLPTSFINTAVPSSHLFT